MMNIHIVNIFIRKKNMFYDKNIDITKRIF